MKQTDLNILREKETEIDNEIIERYNGEFPSLDGVVNWERYLTAPKKILWVLKEGNDPDNGIEDMRSIHRFGTEDSVIPNYKRWKSTYKKLLYVTHGILTETYLWNDMSDIENDGTIDGQFHLEDIAIINLKKVTGGGTANINQIYDYYVGAKDIIFKQIDFFEPDIIINGSRINQFLFDYLGERNISHQGFNRYGKKENVLFVHTYHPNARHNEADYVDSILDIVKKSNPLLSNRV